MNSNLIHVLIVDADPSSEGHLRSRLESIEGVELAGIAHSQRTALNLVESAQPDVVMVDVMFPGNRSADLITQVKGSFPDIQILAFSPGDIQYDRIILAIRAGADGFITRDLSSSEIGEAIEQLHQGRHWLPTDDTFTVLESAAAELSITTQDRRNRLFSIVLTLIPLTGILAAITALLWRDYWGQISVRVVDLGVDPTTRLTDLLGMFLLIIGIFGPLLFVRSWLEITGKWIENKFPSAAVWVANAQRNRLGRLVFNKWVAIGLSSLLLLIGLVWLSQVFRLLVVIIIGPVVASILLANLLDLDTLLPHASRFLRLSTRGVIMFLSVVAIFFLFIISLEVWTTGPDLRTDGLHGLLAPQALGFSANPMMLYDLDGNFDPIGALYLGGNADLYVLYDPCEEIVRMVPVGSSRVEMIDRVVCP